MEVFRTRGRPCCARSEQLAGLGSEQLVRSLVLGDAVGRDAATLVDLHALASGPGPDVGRRGLAACGGPATGTAARTTGASSSTRSASGTDIRIQRITKLLGIASAEIDLVGDAVQTERQRLVSRTAVKVVDKCYLDLLCHGFVLSNTATRDRSAISVSY